MSNEQDSVGHMPAMHGMVVGSLSRQSSKLCGYTEEGRKGGGVRGEDSIQMGAD